MNSYKNYIHVLRSILKNFDDNQFDDIIKNILIKIFDIYYLEKHIQQYNIDNVFKQYNMNMYNLLCRKYVMTKSKRLMFIKHKYDKKEYIVNLLKKNKNFILKDNETYKSIADKIIKCDIDCYTKYVNDFRRDRLLNKEREVSICFHPPCFNKVIDDNYCSNHQDKKYDFLIFHIIIKICISNLKVNAKILAWLLREAFNISLNIVISSIYM